MTTYSLGFDIWARDRASKEFDKLRGSVDKTDQKFGKLKAGIVTGAAIAGTALATFAVGGIDDAARLEMAWRRTDVLFGENAETIRVWAEGAAQNMGLSEEAALTAAGSFGNMFQQLGFGRGEAAKMSTSIVQLVADLAAFNGLPTEQVIEAMSAAFRGEYDALQRVIPGISQARIESEALAMTGKKTADSLTMQEKAAAVLAIVQKDGAAAAGYFASNQDSLAVKSQQSQAAMANLRAEIGSALVPAMTNLVAVAGKVLAWMNENPGQAKALAVAVGILAAGIMGLSVASNIATVAQWAHNSALLAFPGTWIIAALVAVAAGLVLLWNRSETFRTIVTAAFRAVQIAAQVIWTQGLVPLWRGAQQAFAAIANAAISAYNVGVAPMMRLMLAAFSAVMRKFGDMLSSLSRVPGFGWAQDAANKLYGAADGADRLSGRIRNIPAYKAVDIVVTTTYRTAGVGANAGVALGMGRASGGPVTRRDLYLVGEEGPELFVPKQDGHIVPADDTARMLARGGATPVPGAAGSRADIDYLAQKIIAGFRASQREHARELLTVIRATGGGV